MSTWKTGRTWHIKFSGAIVGSSQTAGGGPLGTASADTGSQGTIVCNGVTLAFDAYSKYDYGAVSNLQVSLTAADGYATSQLVHVGDGSGPSSSIDASGSWDVEIDVEEWATTYTPASSALVNGTSFPNYGGTAQGDGLPARGIQYTLFTRPGGTFSCSINSGVVSLSHSFTISTETVVGFLMHVTVFTEASGGDSNITSVGVAFNDVGISTSYHESDTSAYGTMTVDASSGAVEAEVASQGGCQIEAFINPPIQLELYGLLRCFGQTYPGTAKVTWINGSGTTNTLTPSLGAFNDSVTQQEWSCSAWYNAGASNIAFPSATIEQWQAPAAWLSNLGPSGSGDDPRDWRMMFRGFQWSALSLSRSSSVVVDDGSSLSNWTAGAHTTLAGSGGVNVAASGGVGSATLTAPAAVQTWEAWRYLQVTAAFNAPAYDDSASYDIGQVAESDGALYECVASTTGNAPPNPTFWAAYSPSLTVGLAGQTWPLPLDLATTSPRLDLCCAGNDTATVGTKQTRNPIVDPGGFPTAAHSTVQYALGWGVQYCAAIQFSGIPDGCSATFTDVSLVRSSDIQKQSAVTILEPFQDFTAAWTSPTDNTTQQSYLFLEADYRVLDLPALSLVTPIGSGSPYYVWYSIAQLQAMLATFPGLTASLLATPSDGYHGDALPMLLIGGEGATYDWSSNGWTDWIDVSEPWLDIPCQDLWDEVQVYPGCGNPFPQTAPFGGPTPLFVSKSLRAQGWGLVFTPAGVPIDGTPVQLYETANPSIAEGAGTSGRLGQFLTGTPWAFGNVDSQLDLNVPPIPHLVEHAVVQNRQRFRGAFRHVPSILRNLGYDVSNSLRHCRTYANTATGHIGMGCAGNLLPLSWTDGDTGISATWARPRFQDSGPQWPVGLFYGDGTQCHFGQTYDEGASWGTVIDMSTGSIGDYEEGAGGLRWFYKLQSPDGGATWNVWNRVLDAQLNVVRDWTETNVTGVDGEPIAVRESPGPDGAWRIGLCYSIGGALTVSFSFDGLTFA
ncbi:MAG: hypothetical protein P4L46_17480 [Fimbriimonas sp.]|nr:hypothetical protein [Fimbriimonas sp.]